MLRIPTPAEVLETVIQLGGATATELYDEEIVHAHIDALRDLFDERRFVLWLIDPKTGRASLVYATGQLRDDRRDTFSITTDALAAQNVDSDRVTAETHLQVTDAYAPNFRDCAHGFDVAVVVGSQLVGVLGVEYTSADHEPADDRALIGQFALVLATAVSRARLVRESMYLRDYFGQLIEHANAPIIVLDGEGRVSVANRAFLRVLDRPRGEVLGHSFEQLVPRDEKTKVKAVLTEALHGHPTSDHEVHFRRIRGGTSALALNASAIVSADGDSEGIVIIGRDLTELRKLQEQIVQAEKLATLGRLAAGVVHELNNPLTSIKTYGDYLAKRFKTVSGASDVLEKLERIVTSTDRILRFTRDLVTYARPSTEEPEQLSIHQVLDEAAIFCEHVIAENGVRVRREYDPETPVVFGVRRQLHQVFINLITNACHAMPHGAGELIITTRGGDQVEIELRDNGKGIAGDDVDRVFEPFYTTKGEGKGTGLGLSIVRNLLLQHQGAIRVQSNLGEGTTFTVTLPAG